eukprot:6185581-Pleurochrysis_carterae.AAC.2
MIAIHNGPTEWVDLLPNACKQDAAQLCCFYSAPLLSTRLCSLQHTSMSLSLFPLVASRPPLLIQFNGPLRFSSSTLPACFLPTLPSLSLYITALQFHPRLRSYS